MIRIFFLSQSSPILELFPFDKITLKSYICTVVTVMAKHCWSQTVLESGSWGHSVLQTPALVLYQYRCLYSAKIMDKFLCCLDGSVICASDWCSGGCNFDHHWVQQLSFVVIHYEIFSATILTLPLIQEWLLSLLGKRMCTSTG